MLAAMRIILIAPLLLLCDIEMVYLGDDADPADYGQPAAATDAPSAEQLPDVTDDEFTVDPDTTGFV